VGRSSVLVVLLMFVTTPVRAEWVHGYEDFAAAVYIDPASICREGDLCRVLVLYDLKAQGSSGERSISALHEFDCAEERWRVINSATYSGPMATDSVIRSEASAPDRPVEWNYLIPGTPPAVLFGFVCPQPKVYRIPLPP
jgi:hypothetical protein